MNLIFKITGRVRQRLAAGCRRLGLIAMLAGGQMSAGAGPLPETGGPVKVEMIQTNGGYQLYVNHRPFYIKGAGLGSGGLEQLAACGANSLRTWSPGWRQAGGRQILDQAMANGLYVTMGLDIGRERQGFNYDDPAAVARQLARIKQEVLKYKDHPALIIWAIGNELNLNARNPKVWDAVNEISRMIHQVDPNHLTTTPLAGFNREMVAQVRDRAPDLDLISLQMYADIVNLPKYLAESGWTGPYMVTEWGATGHWEVRKTDWGAPIEDNSTVKAGHYQKRFETAIQPDIHRCIGSYVFLWGQKQERTPTWYGMFLNTGEKTASVDVMQYLWTGNWPDVRCPQLAGAWLDGKTANQSIHLHPGLEYSARVEVSHPGARAMTYSWEVMEESTDLKTGGDTERRPPGLPDLVGADHDGQITLKTPGRPGAYRLFAYVYDGQGRAAHANIPFHVDPPDTQFSTTNRSDVARKE